MITGWYKTIFRSVFHNYPELKSLFLSMMFYQSNFFKHRIQDETSFFEGPHRIATDTASMSITHQEQSPRSRKHKNESPQVGNGKIFVPV